MVGFYSLKYLNSFGKIIQPLTKLTVFNKFKYSKLYYSNDYKQF